MILNVSKTERVIRLVIALTIIILYFTDVINGILALVLLSVAGICLISSCIGCCVFYRFWNHFQKNDDTDCPCDK